MTDPHDAESNVEYEQATAMDRYIAKFATRDDMAAEYARLLHKDRTGPGVSWLTLNVAIIDRWSKSGLEYVKTKAWKIATTPSVTPILASCFLHGDHAGDECQECAARAHPGREGSSDA